jgi:hypothetical protein
MTIRNLSQGPSLVPSTPNMALVDDSMTTTPQGKETGSTSSTIPSTRSERSLRELLGLEDIGLTLFSPLDEELLPIRPIHLSNNMKLQDEEDDCSDSSPRDVFLGDLHVSSASSGDQGDSFQEEDNLGCHSLPVQIEPPEDHAELAFAPPIISEEMLQQIVDEALPSNLQMYSTWKRLFSINLHGDCVSTMLNKCKSFRHTLLVVKTSKGTILGGFASEVWKKRGGGFDRSSYYGTGASFLFSDFPANAEGKLAFYKWSGANDYTQLCDVRAGRLALGGGGNFGLVVQDSFMKGSTGPCATFNNPSLVPGLDGTFDIVEFEVYGIVPLMETIHFRDQ